MVKKLFRKNRFMRSVDKNLRVIHLPTPTGGNAWGLSRGERSLGIESDVLYRYDTYFGYPCDIRTPDAPFRVLRYIRATRVFSEIRDKYDVFHYNFGSSLFDWYGKLNLVELPLLKDKKIFVTYNGSDARQGWIDSRNKREDEIKRKRIKKFKDNNAFFFAVNPDIMNFLPDGTVFLPYTIANWESIDCIPNDYKRNKTLTVVHAPTHREIKGTSAVISAIDSIRAKYPNKIELKLVENMTRSQALKEYAKADVVIDQLRIGWYGAFAVEAIKMGKPVMVYIKEEDLHYLPKKMAEDCMEAFINVNETNLEETLLFYMDNPKKLEEKQSAQYDYILKWHDPRYVASITKEKYEESY